MDPVRAHDEQAARFRERYERAERDPYHDTFAYTRKQIDEVCEGYLAGLPPGARLLDVGCGVGVQLRRRRERGLDCAGCDPSEEMLRHARELNPGLDLRRARAEALPWEDGSFDAVLCVEVMRYLPEPGPALAELRRVLRPGGLALVTFAPKLSTSLYPLVNRVASRVRIGRLSRVRQHFHTAGELERLFARAGFAEAEVHARFFGPFLWVCRAHRPLGSRLLRRWEPVDGRLARVHALRNLANLFVVAARRSS